MVHVVKQPSHTTEIITQQGEVKILLEITLNINTQEVQVQSSPVTKQASAEEEKDDRWAIPSFKSVNKITFGKKVGE